MTVKRRTRAELENALRDAGERNLSLKDALERSQGAVAAERSNSEDLRKKLDEVKERLAARETENARMRGYLDRVMEDDHTREELITTGDPMGDEQLVPKRKHREQPHLYQSPEDPRSSFAVDYRDAACGREPRRSRQWVTY